MKLMMQTTSSNEDYDGGCAYAFLILTPELATTILRRHAQFMSSKATDPSIHESYYWEMFPGTFFDSFAEDVDDELPEAIEIAVDELGSDIVHVDFDEVPEAFARRTECEQMIIREDGVSFFCYPKHCSVQITTPEITIDVIRQFLDESRKKAA